MIKLCSLAQLTFKKGKLSAWVWPNHMSPLKLGGVVRDTRSQQCAISGLSMKGAKLNDCRQPSGAESHNSGLQLQGIEFCQQPEWVWKQIFPQCLQMRTGLADTLVSSPVILRTQPRCPCWTFDQWNCKLISGCCFKLLSVSHSSRKLICW